MSSIKVTKLGHCCLLIETGGLRILTDPGSYSTSQSEVKDIAEEVSLREEEFFAYKFKEH
jgi:L-ascorbate metabolism protein UlaG (beta-lactamase superfamily)